MRLFYAHQNSFSWNQLKYNIIGQYMYNKNYHKKLFGANFTRLLSSHINHSLVLIIWGKLTKY